MIENIRTLDMEIPNDNIKGGDTGRLTCFAIKGKSVIDYVIANQEGREGVDRIDTLDRIESNHVPVEVSINVKAKEIIIPKWSESAD